MTNWSNWLVCFGFITPTWLIPRYQACLPVSHMNLAILKLVHWHHCQTSSNRFHYELIWVAGSSSLILKRVITLMSCQFFDSHSKSEMPFSECWGHPKLWYIKDVDGLFLHTLFTKVFLLCWLRIRTNLRELVKHNYFPVAMVNGMAGTSLGTLKSAKFTFSLSIRQYSGFGEHYG